MDFEGFEAGGGQGFDPNIIFRTFFGGEDPFGGGGGSGGFSFGGFQGQPGGKGGMGGMGGLGGMFQQFAGPGNQKFTFTQKK